MATKFSYPEKFGAKPTSIKWDVVRGDTAILNVLFLEDDEVTPLDTTGWDTVSTAFNRYQESFDELEVEVLPGSIRITAPADITESWGTGISARVAELSFDLQITLPDGNVWTPVIGIISVLGDVTGGTL
jgi:hypothetical protein